MKKKDMSQEPGPNTVRGADKSSLKCRKHPLAKALDEWLESPEGKRCVNVSTLSKASAAPFTSNESPYLRNRLIAAFYAGAEASNCRKRAKKP